MLWTFSSKPNQNHCRGLDEDGNFPPGESRGTLRAYASITASGVLSQISPRLHDGNALSAQLLSMCPHCLLLKAEPQIKAEIDPSSENGTLAKGVLGLSVPSRVIFLLKEVKKKKKLSIS